jgi:glyoxylase-like metal-dependent hydrolase (beta-lactamase superfamily II)
MKKLFAVTIATAVNLTVLIAPAAGASDFNEFRLSDRVLVLYNAPWQETMTVVDAGPFLIVVDTWGSLAAAKEAKVRIDNVFGKPVRLVINTHHHWDHTFGNEAFPGAEIAGHRFCAGDMIADYADSKKRKAYFERNASTASPRSLREYIAGVGGETSAKSFRIVVPDRLVGERDTLRAGDLTVLLYHMPGIHTRSNLTVFIPELGIVFGRREFADLENLRLEPGADPLTIARVLEEILSSGRPVHFLVSGHGTPAESPDLTAAVEKLKKMGLRIN